MSTNPDPIEIDANRYARRALIIMMAISAAGAIYFIPALKPLWLPGVVVAAVPLLLLLYTLGGSIYSPQVTHNTVTGNTYNGYGDDIADSSGGVNITTPNTLQPPQPGIYP